MDYSVDKPVEVCPAAPIAQQRAEYSKAEGSNNNSSNGNVLGGDSGGAGNYIFINLPHNTVSPMVQPMLP